MSGIFLGNRTKIFYNPDAGNTTVNSVGYVEIDLLASFPTVTINSDNTSIETYQDEYTQIISGSMNINSVSIVVHYVPDNLSHQYLLDRFSDGEKFQIKISLYESDESLDQHYIILAGFCTAYSDSSDQNAVFDRTYTFTAENVVSRGTAQDQPNLKWGDFGVGADGLTVPHYESSTPSGNSLIKVPALQEQNPLGVDMYGTAWVDGTDSLKIAGNAQGTPHIYVQNSDTSWMKLPEQTEIDATFTPMTRKVNGYDLSADIVLTKSDIGLSTLTDDPQLKIASNLSDLNDTATARTNLDVYSKEETDSLYVPKTLTVNGHLLSGDITVTKSDVGLSTVTDDPQLKRASNLSDLNDTTAARTNLDVYSKEETDSTYVAKILTVNGHDLSTDIVLSSTDTGSLAIANNLSDVDATEARTNLEVLSSTECDAKYAQLGVNSDITNLTALSGALTLGGDAQTDYQATTLRQLTAAISAGGSGGPSLNGVMNNQIGAVSWFVGTRATMWSGYLPADGQILNRADYADVWSAISNGLLASTDDTTWTGSATERAKFSTGDGSTTFRMPDLNGAYSGSYLAPVLRGDGSGTYTVGQMQQNAAPNITGVIRQVAEDAGLYEQNGQTGAFYANRTTTQYWNLFSLSKSGSGGAFPTRIGLDASLSSTVYGRDSTTEIRMNAAIGIWVIRVKGSFSAVGTNFNIINADTTLPSTGTVVFGGDLISKYQVAGADYSAVKLRARTTIGGSITPELVVVDSRGTSTSTTSYDLTTIDGKTGGIVNGGISLPMQNDTFSYPLILTSLSGQEGVRLLGSMATFGDNTSRTILNIDSVGGRAATIYSSGGIMCQPGTLSNNPRMASFNFDWDGSNAALWIDTTRFDPLFTIASDKLLKKDIAYVQDASSLNEVIQWKPATFTYKARGIIPESDQKLGFIANDLVLVSPQCVGGEGLKEGYNEFNPIGAYTLDPVAMIAKLTMAIQEQQKQIETLQTLVNKLSSN